MNGGALLYIDPGTGSMLFTVLLGVIGTGTYFAKKYVCYSGVKFFQYRNRGFLYFFTFLFFTLR